MEPVTPPPQNAGFSPLQWLLQTVGVNVLTVVAAVLMGLALLLTFKGHSLYLTFETYRATKIATEADELMKDERWEMASRVLQDGIRRMPDQGPLLRAAAELFSRGYNDPQMAATFLRRLIGKGEGTSKDSARLAELMLQSGDITECRHIYGELPPAEQTSRKGLELLSGILRAKGSASEADQVLRRALMLDPDDKEARLRLAIMDEAQAMEDARPAIVQTIWEIASKGDDVALKAIEYLAVSKSLTAHQAKELITLVDQHPKAKERVRYLALRAQLRLNPLDHDSVIAQEIQRNQGRSPDQMFDFLRWLGLEGEHQKILDIVPPDSVARDADIFLIYVDALSSSERWQDLLHLMTSRKTPVTQATTNVILAQCYARLQPDLKEARRQLLAAYSAGRKEIPVVLRAAALADGLHLTDLALQGYKIVAEGRPAMRLQFLEKILELQRGDRDPNGMMETLQQLQNLRPRNRSYADQLNYLRLVTGAEIELAYEQLVGFQKPPAEDAAANSSIPSPLLRGLAALRMGNLALVKEEVAKLNSVDLLPAGLRATVSGMLTLSGRDVEGYRLGEKILPGGLLDGERVFLRRSLSN